MPPGLLQRAGKHVEERKGLCKMQKGLRRVPVCCVAATTYYKLGGSTEMYHVTGGWKTKSKV